MSGGPVSGARPFATHQTRAVWTLNSVAVWHLVTGTLGCTYDDYQERIGDLMCAATLRPELRPG